MKLVLFSQFNKYNASQQLLLPSDRILVAVSGGVDSMTLLSLLLRAQYQVAVAHCNFSLRGSESDGDEQLVVDFARENQIQCFVKRFDTAAFAEENAFSIQVAARQLRYTWFYELLETQGFTKLSIAHNANDSVETFFINLLRGTGLQGLTGIAARQGKTVRPLLFAQRSQILAYAQSHEIRFREDSSNASTKYTRNAVRHLIVAELQKLNLAFLPTMQDNLERLIQANNICRHCVAEVRNRVVKQENEQIRIVVNEIPKQHLSFYLYELLSKYKFSGKVIKKIINVLQNDVSGKFFYSPTHQLLYDRGDLLLRLRTAENDIRRSININEDEMNIPIALSATQQLTCSVISPQEVDFSQGESCAFLDYEKLQFPITIRHSRKGDYFIPLGMTGKKKLSDFYIDMKLNTFDKPLQWLFCSENNIAWLVNFRLDDRYKITTHTQKVLQVKYEQIETL
ncbi:tRNA(Ile)-lysidine synthase [Bacteroidia bacterium]|nr:tRNA(Ile)-lysidine synthase [Bacteroidia bacterium]GHT80278.1 tRNA(Ile)-lysidine synthase [Bacteroidia bacterium]